MPRRRGKSKPPEPLLPTTYAPASPSAPPEQPEPPKENHDAPGPRRSRLERRRKRRRWKAGGVVLVLAVAAGAGAYGLRGLLDEDGTPEPGDATSERPDPGGVAYTALLAGEDRNGRAAWLTLVGLDQSSDRAAVVYLPAHVAVEIPGRGLLPLGEALAGGSQLQEMATEGLLGITLDQTAVLDRRAVARLASVFGPLTVDVPSEVVTEGNAGERVLFGEGSQRIAGDDAAELLFRKGSEDDDVDLGGRHLAFWDAALGAPRAGIAPQLASVFEGAGAADPDRLGALLEASSKVGDRGLTLGLAPTASIGVDGEELYSVDREALAELIERGLGTPPKPRRGVTVQILNGVGTPGLGREAAEILIEAGFSVALTGNAQSFDHARTLVIVYGPGEPNLAAARAARKALGAGRLRVSGQEQGIVDLTVVVGRDFQRRP